MQISQVSELLIGNNQDWHAISPVQRTFQKEGGGEGGKEGRGRRNGRTSAGSGTSGARTTLAKPLSGSLRRPLNWCLCFLPVPWSISSQHGS